MLVALVLAAFGLGIWIGRATAPPAPRLSFYPRQQTGVELRRRLFGP
jgi:hypothetical protein